MKSVISLFAVCMLLVTVAFAGPEIQWEKTKIDYGKVPFGKDGTRTFKFKNTGDETLLILHCEASCGCTVPDCPTKGIRPGETGEVSVTYDTKRRGTFWKNVVVMHNAPAAKTVLIIQGYVTPPLPEEEHLENHDH